MVDSGIASAVAKCLVDEVKKREEEEVEALGVYAVAAGTKGLSSAACALSSALKASTQVLSLGVCVCVLYMYVYVYVYMYIYVYVCVYICIHNRLVTGARALRIRGVGQC